MCPALPHPALQLTVETYFSSGDGTGRLTSTYWLGLERATTSSTNSLYTWLDGTEIGNGDVSNTVCAHMTGSVCFTMCRNAIVVAASCQVHHVLCWQAWLYSRTADCCGL